MVKQSYCTGDTGVRIVSECTNRDQGHFYFIVFELTCCFCSFCNLKSNTDCVPFEEGLAEPLEEEEAPKTLLEVSDFNDYMYVFIFSENVEVILLFLISRCIGIR